MHKNRLLTIAVAVIITLGMIGGYATLADDSPVIPPTTGEEPIGTVTLPTPCVDGICEEGSPTPELIPTVTPTPDFSINGAMILDLPSTGAGSTAREIKAANHRYDHYVGTYCRWDYMSYPFLYDLYAKYGHLNPWSVSHTLLWHWTQDLWWIRCYVS